MYPSNKCTVDVINLSKHIRTRSFVSRTAHVTDSFEDAAVFVCETAVIMKIRLQIKRNSLEEFQITQMMKGQS